MPSERDYSDLVGKTFGQFSVLAIMPRKKKSNGTLSHAECCVQCLKCGLKSIKPIWRLNDPKLVCSCTSTNARKKIQERATKAESAPYIVRKLNAKYECRSTIEECIRSNVVKLCCCECDKRDKCGLACKNNPGRCGRVRRR